MGQNIVREDVIRLDFETNEHGLTQANDGINKIVKNTNSATGSTKLLAKGFGLVKVAVAAISLVKITQGLGQLVRSASEFQDSMAKVATIADTSSLSMSDLTKQIKDLSNATGVGANEVAEATYNAISAGQKTEDAVNFVANASSLAKAGFTDLGSAADILTTIMNSYGMAAEDVTKVSDMLIMTQNKGKTTVAELASAMGKIIPTANSMGIGLEQLSAGYAIMTAKGIATAETTTYMNSMLNELGKSSATAAKQLKASTGKTFQDLVKEGKSVADVLQILKNNADKSGVSLSDMFGSAEAGKAALTLISDGADDFNAMAQEMINSVGATSEAFEKLQTPSQKAKIALNQLKNTGITLGESLLSALSPAFATITDNVQKFTEGLNDVVSNGGDMGEFLSSIDGMMTSITGAIADTIIDIISGLNEMSYDIVAGLVESLGLGIEKLATVLPTVVDLAVNIVKGLADGIYYAAPTLVPALVQAVADSVSHLTEALPGLIEAGLYMIQGIAQGLMQAMPVIIQAMPTIMTNIVQALVSVASSLISTGSELLNILLDGMVQAMPVIAEVAPQILGIITEGLIGNLPMLIESAVGLVNGFVTALNSALPVVMPSIVTLVIGIGQALIANAPLLANAGVEMMLSLANAMIPLIPNILTAFGTVVVSLVDSLINQDWATIGTNIMDGLFSGLETAVTNVVSKITEIANTVIDTFKSILGINSPSTVFAEIGGYIIEGLSNGISEAVGSVIDIFNSLYQQITTILQPLSNWVQGNIIKPIVKFFRGLLKDIIKIAKDVYNAITKAWDKLANWVNTNVIQPITKFFSGLWESITKGCGTVQTAITGAFQGAYDTVVGAWGGITGFFEGIWKEVSSTAENIINKGKEMLGIKNQTSGVKQVVKGTVTGNFGKHADGGLITTAHLGLIGEAGPEMIIPLSQSKRDRGVDLWTQAGSMLGVSGSIAYEPDSSVSNISSSNITENNTYAPVFNLTLQGGADRATERKVKQWVKDSMADVFESLSRQNPRLREV